MKTKIIATLGPATEDRLEELCNAGVNIIRFNFSHAQHERVAELKKRIDILNKEEKTNLSSLLDTKGPEIRTGDLESKIRFEKNGVIRMYIDKEKHQQDEGSLYCDYPYLVEDLLVGDCVEIDSGFLSAKVVGKYADYLELQAQSECLIGSRRHINLPGKQIKLPGVTDKDKEDVSFAIQNNFDFIAQSFVRTAQNVQELRDYLDENGAPHIKIIAKIENQEGIENLEEIVQVADGVMVARGDLGIETPIELLPVYQKQIVEKCLAAGKFFIIATQLLETMMENPFPTRAEVSDVFNSVIQKADCLMLSGETAMGKYPIDAVKIMRSVATEAEKQLAYDDHIDFANTGLSARDIEKKYMIRSALFMADDLNADALLIFTKKGKLARLASAFRPDKKVFALTGQPETVGTLRALFGVTPVFLPDWGDSYAQNFESAVAMLLKKGLLTKDSKILAINDIQKNGKEFPILEIVHIADYC